MARRLANALEDTQSVGLAFPVQSNGVFAELDRDHARRLQQEWTFHVWSESADNRCVVRWMTAFNTSEADVDRLAASIMDTAASVGGAVSAVSAGAPGASARSR
jgi:threonine aldolase